MPIYTAKPDPGSGSANTEVSLTADNGVAATTATALIVAIRYAGDAFISTTRANGEVVGTVISEANFEYDLFKNASGLHSRCASAAFDLLRFGRVLGPETLVPSSMPNWRKICYDGGQGWINLASTTIHKYSDADFPQWLGWIIIDESGDLDSRVDTKAVKSWLDLNKDSAVSVGEATSQLSNEVVKRKLARVVCKIPTEWSKSTIDTRWGWLKQKTVENEHPLEAADFEELKQHIAKLCFWEDANLSISPNHWHFDPKEFIRTFKKCGWLSQSEMLQLVPEHIIRKSGSHGSSNPSFWESPNIATARAFLTNHRVELNKALRKFLITSPYRQAAFFGNAVQETGWFKDLRESSGNTPQLHSGWYGRGFLQLTNPNGNLNAGNNNYYKYFRFLGREPRIPPGPQELGWRDEIGSNSYHAAHSAAAYWVWPDKSGSVHNSNVYADVLAVNQRKTINTAQGIKVWYYNRSFAKCASSVNLPGSINSDPPNTMNGLVDRSTAFVNALVVLSDRPVFRDEHNQEILSPENFKRRSV